MIKKHAKTADQLVEQLARQLKYRAAAAGKHPKGFTYRLLFPHNLPYKGFQHTFGGVSRNVYSSDLFVDLHDLFATYRVNLPVYPARSAIIISVMTVCVVYGDDYWWPKPKRRLV